MRVNTHFYIKFSAKNLLYPCDRPSLGTSLDTAAKGDSSSPVVAFWHRQEKGECHMPSSGRLAFHVALAQPAQGGHSAKRLYLKLQNGNAPLPFLLLGAGIFSKQEGHPCGRPSCFGCCHLKKQLVFKTCITLTN